MGGDPGYDSDESARKHFTKLAAEARAAGDTSKAADLEDKVVNGLYCKTCKDLINRLDLEQVQRERNLGHDETFTVTHLKCGEVLTGEDWSN